ncbi:MAG TPA: phosphoenolpyruvate carboxykinase (ATP) [Hanamia sp.]|nr:phosphoenolpyruvate carboxykinase (ATP) [Hanamia sp.]
MSVPTMFTIPRNMLFSLGLPSAENTFYQLSPEELTRQCLERNEGELRNTGALVINTGKVADRSSKELFIVKDKITANTIDWNDINHPLEKKYFDSLYQKMIDHLGKNEIWIRDSYYDYADLKDRLSIRIINEDPTGNLFAFNMFLSPSKKELENFNPDWYIIQVTTFFANPKTNGTRDKNFTIVNFSKKVILIGGSAFTGEIKKDVFSILNLILPHDKIG